MVSLDYTICSINKITQLICNKLYKFFWLRGDRWYRLISMHENTLI